MNAVIRETTCRSVLQKSTMGFAEYTLNAYLGCTFACSYCYVPAMRGKRGQPEEHPWGGWVEVKTNAVQILRQEMLRIPPTCRIAIGTAADSWQPIERRFGIARRILEVLTDYDNPIGIVTRSPLLMRDIDLLRRIRRLRVGVSIPTFDDRIRAHFEPSAPTISARVRLVRALVDADIRVQLMFAPILPEVCDNRTTVEGFVQSAAKLGVSSIVLGSMGYLTWLGDAHMKLVSTLPTELRPVWPALGFDDLQFAARRAAHQVGIRLSDEREREHNMEFGLFAVR